MQINMHPTGSRIKSMLCFWKKKNSAKMQINMTHTGGQKSTENLHLESGKDSSTHRDSSGRMDDMGVCPCFHCCTLHPTIVNVHGAAVCIVLI